MSDEKERMEKELDEHPIELTKEQFDQIQQIASEFNLTIQAGFLEMMEKLDGVDIDHPAAGILKGNYAPLAIGAALAAIVERYDPSCEKEFWSLVMNKYTEAREKFAGILESDQEKEGVTTIEMQPTYNMSKMKH